MKFLFWGHYMERIRDIIEEIIDQYQETLEASPEAEILDEEAYFYYTDIFVNVQNGESFYELGSHPLANRLLNSFLLEATSLLRKSLDTVYVESGIDYIKATLATPSSEVASYIFEDVVLIHTMVDEYNQALAEQDCPLFDVSISCALYEDLDGHEEDEEECECDHVHECDCEHDHDCNCEHEAGCDCEHDHDYEHHHHHHEGFSYPVDALNQAQELIFLQAEYQLEPLLFNEAFYELLALEKDELPYLQDALEKFVVEDDFVIYHGNIIEENEEE